MTLGKRVFHRRQRRLPTWEVQPSSSCNGTLPCLERVGTRSRTGGPRGGLGPETVTNRSVRKGSLADSPPWVLMRPAFCGFLSPLPSTRFRARASPGPTSFLIHVDLAACTSGVHRLTAAYAQRRPPAFLIVRLTADHAGRPGRHPGGARALRVRPDPRNGRCDGQAQCRPCGSRPTVRTTLLIAVFGFLNGRVGVGGAARPSRGRGV